MLLGAEQPPERLGDIITLLRRSQADTIVLQELLDWSESQLVELARAIGFPTGEEHVYLAFSNMRGSGKRYHLGVLTRQATVSRQTHAPDFMAHSCAEVRFSDGLTLFGAHLIAREEAKRLREAEYLSARVFPRERVAGERMVLAGDLNALSARDPYEPDMAARLLESGCEKYGDPLQTVVMEKLEKTGWVDSLYLGGRPSEWVTRWRGPDLPTRTDYTLVSPKLVEQVLATEILPLPRQESDHHPVLLTLN